MIHDCDERTIVEHARYALRFACEDCAHFQIERGRCSLEYPNEAHLRAAPLATHRLVFCKEFELV